MNLVDITKSVTIPSNLSHLWAGYPQRLYYKLEGPFNLFNLVVNLSHAESAENTELPVLDSLVHAGAGFHRLSTRFTVPAGGVMLRSST